MGYKCLSCGREIDDESIRERIRCPYCGYRTISKTRPNKVTKIKAR
jgi:DNA-directed RNA polymerase subunit RPC12/RpoP